MKRLVEVVLVAGAVLGAVAIWLIGAIVTWDVTLRFLGQPTLWALEISTYLMLGAATLGGGLAVINGQHFSVDIVTGAFPPVSRRWLGRVTDTVCLGLILFVTYGFWRLIDMSVMLDMKSATLLRIPLVYPQSVLFLAFGLMALAFLHKILFPRG